MKNGSIQPIQRARVESRSDVRLASAWIRESDAVTTPTAGDWLGNAPFAAGTTTAGPVLATLAAEGAAVHPRLTTLARGSTRVYLLVGPRGGLGDPEAALLRSPNVLARRVPEVPLTALHEGSLAQVWLGGGHVLRLDGPQAEALRQVFLRLFWHEATEEAFFDGKQTIWRPVGERPFDVPETLPTAVVRWERRDALLSGFSSRADVHWTRGAPPSVPLGRLWFPPSGEHQDRLAAHVRAGSTVRGCVDGLPDLFVDGERGEVLLAGERGRLRLCLCSGQISELARRLEGPGPWRFRTEIALGEPAIRDAQLWLPGETGARGLETEQKVPLPEVVAASLRRMDTTDPAEWPAPQPLARSVEYRWTVLPPRVPREAVDDALVGEWRTCDDAWKKELQRIRAALDEAEQHRGRIASAFARLVGPMLGFQRTREDLQDRVAALEIETPSRCGPERARSLFERLSVLGQELDALHADLSKSERKAREDDAREQQHAAWTDRVERAKRDLSEARRALETETERKADVARTLAETRTALQDADKSTKKDLEARVHRLSDELSKCEKTLVRLEATARAADAEARSPFVFDPPASPERGATQPGARFVPPAAAKDAARRVPRDALPAAGRLRCHKGTRYLVLGSWDDLPAAEPEATRLDATLVAAEAP